MVLVECTINNFFMTFFGQFRLVTIHVLSITPFPSCFFLTFPLKYYLYKKISCPTRIICYFKNYMFIGMIISRRSINLSFQSHHMCRNLLKRRFENAAESGRTVLYLNKYFFYQNIFIFEKRDEKHNKRYFNYGMNCI